MVLNQNSSADRLGLNPAGLTKWEKHYKSVKSHSLVQVSFSKEKLCLSEARMDLAIHRWKALIEYLEQKTFPDRQEDRRLSKTTQNAKGKHDFFLCLKQASSTRQVLETKKIL